MHLTCNVTFFASLHHRNCRDIEPGRSDAKIGSQWAHFGAHLPRMLANVSSLMSQVGPVITAVKLCANGNVEQLKLDMTPAKNELAGALGGIVGLFGQLPGISVVAAALRDGIIEDEEEDGASKLKASVEHVKASAKSSKMLAKLTAKGACGKRWEFSGTSWV